MSLSNITLSAAVRQNLLSLQDTATLLSQTQERLATGKKVNSALDNPTNFFTAAGLDSRASDISNLLD
ncbi:MAG TPA: flagellar protein, partial [Bradyrhizobium sp.]|nr:flagellar protein [Bradyrhizobium sp.]